MQDAALQGFKLDEWQQVLLLLMMLTSWVE
jgi:hypothetical protein